MPATLCATCLNAQHGDDLQADGLLRPLLPALLPWLVTRRWFTHEQGHLEELRPVSASVLDGEQGGDRTPVLLHSLLDARHGADVSHHYQLLVGLRPELPEGLGRAVIGRAQGGRWDGWTLYEATEDHELMERLLERTVGPGGEGGLRMSLTGAPAVPTGLSARALAVEQSNSTVVFGDQLLFKLFRQPEPGPHPETDALRGLTQVHCRRIPGLAGWLHTDGGEPVVLGILEEFLPARGDGWQLAVEQAAESINCSLRSVPVLDCFTEDSRALGAAVAEVHASLAQAFGQVTLTPDDVAAQVDQLRRELRAAVQVVPQLEPYAGRLGGLYEDWGRLAGRGLRYTAQRIHGDLHLGQVLSTEDGWKVIDFEGEPARPVAERYQPQPVLRDVAGMLRSFDYAGQQALAALPESAAVADGPLAESAEQAAARMRRSRRAYAWSVRNRRAFTAGYAAAGGMDPYCQPVALRAFEAEKAVYEAVYEAQHRPDWLPIPMAAIQRLVFGR
ncbi:MULTISPECIES: maltokinase N-terminal cap-like domain-containing protein [Kitasatospora]|uniref:maltokinase N-terminal cap-like domain-containing protein n=1 Tax=Kitasatospora TaxID=2063 RepID=UPI000C70E2CB|nr:phosphotransferase [Kitasatospora sp. GP30]MDH6138638.1 maltokinase [Kitasatospora sp. GP30]